MPPPSAEEVGPVGAALKCGGGACVPACPTERPPSKAESAALSSLCVEEVTGGETCAGCGPVASTFGDWPWPPEGGDVSIMASFRPAMSHMLDFAPSEEEGVSAEAVGESQIPSENEGVVPVAIDSSSPGCEGAGEGDDC